MRLRCAVFHSERRIHQKHALSHPIGQVTHGRMFSLSFMRCALLAGVLISVCASLLGVTLVLKRYSMIGDGLSHVGFGALAIATSFHIADVAVGFALPVVVMVAAWSFFLFSLAKELVSGVLLVALLSLALCFAGGCMYPASFFPDAVRQAARFLPTGLAMEQLSCCVTGGQGSGFWLLLYSAGFAALTWLHRVGSILGGGSVATPE